jgi:acetyl-CoA carboxylase carboxyl transferase subunit beta
LAAWDRLHSLVDDGTFRETERDLVSTDPLGFDDGASYTDRLQEQRRRTGLFDAVVTGSASIQGVPVVVGVLDFGFMGGSMGVVVGEKIARAAELARDRRQPLVTVVASGGARMQEGMFSLLQMAKTASAIQQLRRAGIPYISVLTHPTTGGVFASFASLGDIVIAEPTALIGFAGPRVVEQVLGKPLPPGSHSAEFLLHHGIIDLIVDRRSLRGTLGAILQILGKGRPVDEIDASNRALDGAPADLPAWETVEIARDPIRPTSLDYTTRITDRFIELHGDRESGDDPAIVAGLGSIAGRSVILIGLERGHDDAEARRYGRPAPEGYRKAQRLMHLAARFDLPVVTLIDTPGAYPGVESEERGLAGEIAETLALMSDLPAPTVAAVTGEGGSGGALALAVADRVLMQQHAIYSVIAPEGAAAILYRDASRAPEVAAKLKLTAVDCAKAGIVDVIVPEPSGSASADPDLAAALLKAALVKALDRLEGRPVHRLVQMRGARYRAIGQTGRATADRKASGKAAT